MFLDHVLQRALDLAHRLRTTRGVLIEASRHAPIELRDAGVKRFRFVVQNRADDLRAGRAVERAAASRQLVDHCAETEYVRTGVERAAFDLFRRSPPTKRC
jgi:hypothetical protein